MVLMMVTLQPSGTWVMFHTVGQCLLVCILEYISIVSKIVYDQQDGIQLHDVTVA